MILHIDMDAFFASIEQAINPRLKGKPLIVGSRNNRMHTVVCAASYEAKACGIDSGMPSWQALQLCPHLEFVPAQQGRYIWTSEQIFQMLKDYGFSLAYTSIDEFQMDINDSTEPQKLARQIQERIYADFHITASIGIAKNWLLAKLASKLNKPNGIAVLTDANLTEILTRVPANKICGVGKNTGQILSDLGVKTCLDLFLKNSDFLTRNLGKYGLNLYLSLHSREGFEPAEEASKPKSVGHSYTLPRATQTPGFIKAWIRLLSEMVAQRLRAQNLLADTVHLWLNGPEMGNLGVQKAFHEGSNDGYQIYQRSLTIMAKIGPKSPKIRALGVTCSGLLPNRYFPLFKEQKRREDLLKTIDKINSRFGEGVIYPGIIELTKRMPGA
jgi:DNA polymerase-4